MITAAKFENKVMAYQEWKSKKMCSIIVTIETIDKMNVAYIKRNNLNAYSDLLCSRPIYDEQNF